MEEIHIHKTKLQESILTSRKNSVADIPAEERHSRLYDYLKLYGDLDLPMKAEKHAEYVQLCNKLNKPIEL